LRAIVFDLDDTLYPERAFVDSGFRAVASWGERRLGLAGDAVYRELMSSFDEGVRGNTFDHFVARHGVGGDGLVQEMIEVYREHAPQIAPYPGAGEMLARLRGRFLLGLLTDGPGDMQRRKISALGLGETFDAVFLTDDLGRGGWKPSSRPFAAILALLAVPADQATYVGDNPAKDFLGARRIGMETIRIHHGDGLYSGVQPPSPEHAPFAEVNTLEELEALVTSWLATGPAVPA